MKGAFVAASVSDVVKRIEGSGILGDPELTTVRDNADRTDGDAEKFVRLLIENELLTTYQARAIWYGEGHKLSFCNYIVESELGRGGMGVVLKARHKRMKRDVAIKVLPSTLTTDASAIARFQREVEAAAQLTHPNIVSAFDADEINGEHFLVMELVGGRDLSSIVRQNGPLTAGQALNYAIQAATGLEFAHGQGVIHRDVKPANLLLDRNGTVKILDMGLARFSDTAEVGRNTELTGTGLVMGTVDYMSPEQALDSKSVDARSDIYSLGISLYYFLTGRSAYDGNTFMARLVAHRENPIPSLRDDRPDIAESIQQVFEKMVAKQVNDRFQSMAETIVALEVCLEETIAMAGEVSSVPSKVLEPSDDLYSLDFFKTDDASGHTGASSPTVTKPLPSPEANLSTIVVSWEKNTDQSSHNLVADSGSDNPAVSARDSGNSKRVLAGLSGCALLTVIAFAVYSQNAVDTTPVSVPESSSGLISAHANGPNGQSTGTNEPGQRSVVSERIPSLAVAPFDAEEARAHQQAWGEYLNLPVEYTHPCGLQFMLIPPGRFRMGAPEGDLNASKDEQPQHDVTLTNPFQIGVTEVTIGQFRKFVKETGYKTDAESDEMGAFQVKPHKRESSLVWSRFDNGKIDDENIPVTCVSWKDAGNFCDWLGQQDKSIYRLPTEAEWEYSCRAGSTTRYSFGNEFDKTLATDGENGIQVVAMYPANAFGLFDMHGNVHEICMDSGRLYTSEPVVDPVGPNLDTVVVRSGAVSSSFNRLRSSHRYLNDFRDYPDKNFATPVKGFRVVRLPKELPAK